MNYANTLIEKSTEAFTMAIEIYNKPTIKYRVEGFSMFICNAWELMLKSHIINEFGESDIYFKDNPERTISLEKCVSKIFTNEKDPLRINLDKIIELRNTSTHFITEEYEIIYIPLFQACVFNYVDKVKLFHDIDILEQIPQNFLTLSVCMNPVIDTNIQSRYPETISNKILDKNSEIAELSNTNNQSFSISINHNYYITKDKSKSDSFICIDNNSENKAKKIVELKDPNNTHKYTAKSCIEIIKKELQKMSIEVEPGILAKNKNGQDEIKSFNNYHFQLFCKHFSLKENELFCYVFKSNKQKHYKYSQKVIDLIIGEFKKDHDIIKTLKNKTK